MAFNSYSRENTVPNQYQFNGKETQEELGLGWTDYGARMLDQSIGRWQTVDLLSEFTMDWSPYTYTYNNPVNFIDPTGLYGEPMKDKAAEFLQNAQDTGDGNISKQEAAGETVRQSDIAASYTIGKREFGTEIWSGGKLIGREAEGFYYFLQGQGSLSFSYEVRYQNSLTYRRLDSTSENFVLGINSCYWLRPCWCSSPTSLFQDRTR